MNSLLLRLTLAIPLAVFVFPASADGQQSNRFADNSAQSNRRSRLPADVTSERIKQDFNTAPRTGASAHIRLTGSEGSNNLRHYDQHLRQNAHQTVSVAPPVRFATYEADLSPNLNQIELDQPPQATTEEDSPNNSDLSGIRQALNAYRSQPNLVKQVNNYDSLPHAESAAMDATDQQSFQQEASQTPSQLDEPTKKQPKLNSLGLAFSDDSRKLIERIAYNLLFVLTLGVGFIFVAKKWMKVGGAEVKPSKSEFEVLNTLNLPGKSTLMLIKVNSDRLMVATDSTGVKSVVHLTDSFTENIDAYDDVPEPSAVNQLQQTRSFADHLERETLPNPVAAPKKKHMESRPTPRENIAEKNTEAIQRQMEAALKKFGLKGLV